MKLTPRGVEVKAVAELLESGDYDSPEALAKAVIKKVAELLGDREMYAWFYRQSPEGFALGWGPFTSENNAKGFAAKYVDMLDGTHAVFPLNSPNELTRGVEGQTIPSFFCTTCNHQLISHEHPKIQPKCAVRGCKCRKKTTE